MSNITYYSSSLFLLVSILVVLEFGLWVHRHVCLFWVWCVSILVVLEFGLWGWQNKKCNEKSREFQSLLFWNSVCEPKSRLSIPPGSAVSILVVLEFGLWVNEIMDDTDSSPCFNPCCFGIRSVSWLPALFRVYFTLFQSLLFWNSVCEQRYWRRVWRHTGVSILVVLEFGLWASGFRW